VISSEIQLYFDDGLVEGIRDYTSLPKTLYQTFLLLDNV